MSAESLSGAKIRQDFIDFFVEQGHTFVPSSSLVPGGDQNSLVYKRRDGAVQRCFSRHR